MALVDPRVTKQADILVSYSTKAKKGDRALVVADFEARPLALAVYKKLLQKGVSEVRVHFDVDEQVIHRSYNQFSEVFFKYATPAQIKTFPKIAMEEIKNIDCWYRLYGVSNTRGFTNIDQKKISQRALVTKPILDFRVDNTRWVITNFPTEALAQEADMSLSEYENFVFNGINKVDWKKIYKKQEKLRKIINSTSEVHLIGPGTDLRLNIAGRKAENAGGEHNMPDGEVFTSVVEDSAKGFISFTYPALYMGKEFHDVRLEFKDGRAIKATAEKGEKDLNKILDTDKGARFIGELGFGNNYKITRFTKDILFDEKIGGSIHLALGLGYKETGSKNESAIHWDMIKDLRKGIPGRDVAHSAAGGEIWFDDKLVQKDGKWLA